MTGVEKEEFPPLLPVGFHDFDVAGLRRLCVDRFTDSITRRFIMDGLEEVLSLLQRNGMRGEVWINGSFTTEKLNPDDSDVMLIVSIDDFRAFTAVERAFFDTFRRSSLKGRYRCDNYAMVRDESHAWNDWTIAYWPRQFGFSRSDEMKGLAVVRLPFLIRP